MKDIEIRSMVLKIMDKAVIKTASTESDVFVDFYAHVRRLKIEVFINGWKEGIVRDHQFNIKLEPGNESKAEILEDLQKVYNLIYSL